MPNVEEKCYAKANPATVKRTDEKIASGEYKYLETNDDVELYELAEWSDLCAKSVDEMSPEALERAYVYHARKRNWDTLVLVADALKMKYTQGYVGAEASYAQLQLQSVLANISSDLNNRSFFDPTTPGPAEIHMEMQNVRKKARKGQIYLPR